jgi:excisionase family DNA binding protein
LSESLLTVADVAELLGVTPRTVLRRWRRGDLRGYRLFGEGRGPVRFRRDEIERTIESWDAERDVGRGSVTDPDTTSLGKKRIVGLVTDPKDDDEEAKDAS